MEHYVMNLTLKVWRQKNSQASGKFKTYQVKNISSEMSFLEMFDVLNEELIREGKEPIAFDHDCREGICRMCSMYINGRRMGPGVRTQPASCICRAFKDGDTIVVEPWRAAHSGYQRTSWLTVPHSTGSSRPVVISSVNTGNAVDANAIPIDKKDADHAFEAAACIWDGSLCGNL